MNYYNEWDPYAAAWLRNLIAAGLLPDGDVDERSITDVQPSDLEGYTQCHFFAGIGGWPRALELAGWPADAPVWTGSCPCQPFSTAGKHGGTDDARHLWPEFQRLIAVCQPPIVFGEQVASLAGRGWLAGVRVDLEAMDYAVGAADLCAASVGAPHIRSRLWWVADAKRSGRMDAAAHDREHVATGRSERDAADNEWQSRQGRGDEGAISGVDDSDSERRDGESVRILKRRSRQASAEAARASAGSGVGDTERTRLEGRRPSLRGEPSHRAGGEPIATAGFWDNAESIPCLDGKSRRVEPGVAPLVDGVPGRVGQLRAYGNAISPQVAAVFIKTYTTSRKEESATADFVSHRLLVDLEHLAKFGPV
jgi:DNA (cytosine-5)-methyltransferase 1